MKHSGIQHALLYKSPKSKIIELQLNNRCYWDIGSCEWMHVIGKLSKNISRGLVNAYDVVLEILTLASANSTSLSGCGCPHKLSEVARCWWKARMSIVVVWTLAVPTVHSRVTIRNDFAVGISPIDILTISIGKSWMSNRQYVALTDGCTAALRVADEVGVSRHVGSILVKPSDCIGSREALILECRGGQIGERSSGGNL